jgi:hypothetical protein
MSFAQTHISGCGGLFRQHQRPQQLQSSRCPARQIAAQAKKGAPDPPDTPKQERRGGREWLQTMLSRFGPIAEKAENTAVLDFEKPLVELDNRIKEVSTLQRDTMNPTVMSSGPCMPGGAVFRPQVLPAPHVWCAPYSGAESG